MGRFRQIWWRLLPGSIASLGVVALLKLGTWQPLEQIAYTALFNLRGANTWSDRVVVIAIDDASLREFGQFPWPRQRYAQLLTVLSTAQPNVVAFDIIWSEPSPDDSTLAAAMAQHGLVVLAQAWDSKQQLLLPVPELQAAATVTGHLAHQSDADGMERRAILQLHGEMALGVAALAAYALVADPGVLPDNRQTVWLNWPASVNQAPQYSFADVVQGGVPAAVFQDKIVLVGLTAAGFDTVRTPFDQDPPASGVFLHAAVLNTILQHNALQRFSDLGLLLLLLLSGPGLSGLLTCWQTERQLLAWLGLCLGWGMLSLALFHACYWLPIASPIALFTGTIGIAALCERLRMNQLLQREVEQLWQAHYADLVIRQGATRPIEDAGLSQPIPMRRVEQLAVLAQQFGRSQSAQAAIARSLSVGLLAVDLDDWVWFCNPVAAHWLKLQVGDRLSPHVLSGWLSEADWQADLQSLHTLGIAKPREVQRDGQWFEMKLEPLFYQAEASAPAVLHRQMDGLLLVITDITDRQEMAQLKDEFVSMVSHELRTPITSIRGSLGLLLTGKLGTLSDKGQRMLEIATNNTDRLIRLINDILDLERIESGKISLEKQVCSLDELMLQAAETMQAMADQTQITLTVSAPALQLMVDPDRLLQVLTNLLSNAIKFSPPGSTISLTAEAEVDPTETVLIQVKDQGRGIPADQLEAVFGRFQQVKASDAQIKSGSGLGLAICRAIAQQQGGKIWVESTLNQGSTFFIRLPQRG